MCFCCWNQPFLHHRQCRPWSRPSPSLTLAIVMAYPLLTSTIVAAIFVVNINHHRGQSVVDVGHHCGRHRHWRQPSSWPLLLSTSALLRPSLLSMSAIIATVSVIDVGHPHSHLYCWRQPSSRPSLLSASAIVVAVFIVNVSHYRGIVVDVGHRCGRHHCQPWRGHLQSHCCHWSIVHIIVKLIVISIVFNSFNNVDPLRSMLADCCMPWCRRWGTKAAMGQQRLPWLAGVCILPSFS